MSRMSRLAATRSRALQAWRVHWRAHAITASILLLVWLALWGDVTIPLLAAGIALAILVLIIFPLPPIETHLQLHPIAALMLVGRFAFDVVAASLQVSFWALRRKPPIPAVVVVALASDSDLIQHLTALAVSLVPGSLIIDADPDQRTLTIHVLYSAPEPPDRFIRSVLDQEQRFVAALMSRKAPQQPAPLPDSAAHRAEVGS